MRTDCLSGELSGELAHPTFVFRLKERQENRHNQRIERIIFFLRSMFLKHAIPLYTNVNKVHPMTDSDILMAGAMFSRQIGVHPSALTDTT
ncbi:hypothetical protein AVEN_97800-1 [Araneus ventricosus]|uniref:Uncharacterized protein n=1 Tax=Araneus ventricosus TaxID=182803 RepID=A0A4Y2FVH2_ARAVE|nr:hypothetical protein AVEN_97800-1 [Araneus ventricosus]